MTYQITYINSSTNRPVLNMTIGAKDIKAAKAKASAYYHRHMRTPKVTMLVKEV